MRILYLTHNVTWKGGGAFFRAYHQARYLVRRGHQVTVVSISPESKSDFHSFQSDGVAIVEAPDLLPGQARTGWDLWDALRRTGRLDGRDYDIVHGLESRPVVALPALWMKRRSGVPVILDWADWYGRGGTASERSRKIRTVMHPVETFCEEFFHPLADGVVAMGEPLLERAASLGVPRGRMINLLHGCDPEGLAAHDRAEARAQLGPERVPADAYILGYVGVMRPTTAALFFDALQKLKPMLDRPVKVVCAGNHKLLSIRSFLPADCQDDLIETGWISYEELNLFLSASDVMALPFQRMIATNNIWPSKLNDYLAVGRPTVATDMRILQPIFAKYDIGLLTDDTPQAFAEGCARLLADEAGRARMSQQARALAEGDLSWNSLVDKLEAFYVRLIEEVGRQPFERRKQR